MKKEYIFLNGCKDMDSQSYRQESFKEDFAIVTVEGSFDFKKVTKKKAKRGFHTLKPGILGDFNPKGKVYLIMFL